MRIRTKINTSFILTFIIVVAIIATFTGLYTTNLVKKNIYSYLHSSSRARAEHIRTFIQDQEKTAEILAAASVYLDFIKEPTNSKQYPIIKDKILKRFQRTLLVDPQIIEIDIIDLKGKIIASSNPKAEGGDESKDEYFLKGLVGTFIKDVYILENNKISYAVSTPIKDSDGTVLGVSLLRYKPDLYYSIVKNENGLGDTEENFLINREKYFITPSLFLGQDVILKQQVQTQNANDCYDPREVEYVKKNGYSGLVKTFGSQVVNALDYRNVKVIATHAYLPETDWCLITKVDQSEVMSFRIALTIVNILIIIGSLIIFSLLGFFVARKITQPLKNLELVIERIKNGDLDSRMAVDSNDEIGLLAGTFNDMVAEVKNSKIEIQKKVEEQTRDIKNKTQELENQKSAILNILEDVKKEKEKNEILSKEAEDQIRQVLNNMQEQAQKLIISNSKDRAIFAGISDGIVTTNEDGIITLINESGLKMLGLSLDEVINKPAVEVLIPREENGEAIPLNRHPMVLALATGEKAEVPLGKTYYYNRKDNTRFPVGISVTPFLFNSKIIGTIEVFRDITIEKDIDRAKTEFVSLASHQLRTPLTSIGWYTEMLMAGDAGEINEKQREYLQEVATGNKRMTEMVSSLLNVSRIELGSFSVDPVITDIVEIPNGIITELRPLTKEKNITIETSYDENLEKIPLDARLMRIVYQNLLTNAVKYTPAGGKIKVEVKYQGDEILSSVADNGYGIPQSQQGQIFQKLFRADNAKEKDTNGTGLGLYIVRSIIEQSAGGRIWFESTENKGTTFFFTIPKNGMVAKKGSKPLG